MLVVCVRKINYGYNTNISDYLKENIAIFYRVNGSFYLFSKVKDKLYPHKLKHIKNINCLTELTLVPFMKILK